MSVLISVDQLKEGMILQAPAKNKYGQVLLAKGAVLQPQHKRLLGMWGITTIVVFDENENDEIPVYDQRVIAQATETLSKRIAWLPENAFEKDLLDMAVKQLLKRQAQGEH